MAALLMDRKRYSGRARLKAFRSRSYALSLNTYDRRLAEILKIGCWNIDPIRDCG